MSRLVVAVATAGAAGQVSAAVVGALPWGLLPVSLLLYVAAVRTGVRAPESRTRTLRHLGLAIALVGVGVVLADLPSSPEPEAVKGSLGLMLVAAQIGQALAWRLPRELRSGLVTAVGLLVLSASYSPDVLVGAPLVIGWVAVLVALATLQGARPVLPVTAVAVVLGLVAFLLVPVPVSAGLRSRLAGAAPAPARADLGARAFSGDELDLNQRGALTKDPIVSVPADSPTLWRAAAFDRYDGRTWARPESTVLAGPPYSVALASGPTRVDEVELRGRTDGTIWSPGPLVDVEGRGSRIPLVNELGDVQLPGLRDGYRTTSTVEVTDPVQLRSRRGADLPDDRWRTLPADLPDRVTALARQLVGGTTNRYDAADAIAQWLRANATYRLDSPVPGPGEDAVDRFLFVDRVGFCEQFASAEVVLLRAVGIPARLVTGLAYGVPEGSDRRLYRVADLHAWVELWVPGSGWVSSDPTAGVPLAASAGLPLRQRVSTAVTSALRSLTSVPGGRTGLAVLLLAATGLVGLALSRRPAPRRTPEGAALVRGGPALQAFLRLDGRLGPRRRRPGESLRELSSRMEPEVARALEVVERECYAPVAPDPRAAVEVLDRY